jgi:hypothetical protein
MEAKKDGGKDRKGGFSMKKGNFLIAILVIGVLALIGCATAQGVYLNDDGTTFTRNFSGIFSANVPYSIYSDTFSQSEVIRQYMDYRTQTYVEPAWTGVRSSNAVSGNVTANDPIPTPRTYQIIETYEVTVTRHWYTRKTYYQNQKPSYSMVYRDEETRRLVNTERRYLN